MSGAIVTVFFLIFMVMFLGFLFANMVAGDNSESQKMINPLWNDTNRIDLWGKFMPSMQIRSNLEPSVKAFQAKNPDIDILDDSQDLIDTDSEPIDIQKLSKYLIMHINARHR